MTEPDPNGAFVGSDGVEIPMGKGKSSTIGQSSLLYNEYPFDASKWEQDKILLKLPFPYLSWLRKAEICLVLLQYCFLVVLSTDLHMKMMDIVVGRRQH